MIIVILTTIDSSHHIWNRWHQNDKKNDAHKTDKSSRFSQTSMWLTFWCTFKQETYSLCDGDVLLPARQTEQFLSAGYAEYRTALVIFLQLFTDCTGTGNMSPFHTCALVDLLKSHISSTAIIALTADYHDSV